MKLTFINAGYGEAILLTYGTEQNPVFTAMIDGGGNRKDEFDDFPWRIRAWDFLRQRGIHHLDLLISTHSHEDHNCGLLEIIRNCSIGQFWCAYDLSPEQSANRFCCPEHADLSLENFIASLNTHNEILSCLRQRNTPIRVVNDVKEAIRLAPELNIDILGPDPMTAQWLQNEMSDIFSVSTPDIERIRKLDARLNLTSIMLRLHYRGKTVFLPGDVNRLGCQHLKDRPDLMKADILKIGHHGQKDALQDWQLASILPSVVVTCASSDRRYNSAHPDVYAHIKEFVTPHGITPVFLFSDNVELPPYSDGMIPHKALTLNISDTNGELTYYYEQ